MNRIKWEDFDPNTGLIEIFESIADEEIEFKDDLKIIEKKEEDEE